jgi:hypothetical protein
MIFVLLRYFGFPPAFLGWLIYQLFIKKNKWAAIKTDVMIGGSFVCIATILFVYLARQ